MSKTYRAYRIPAAKYIAVLMPCMECKCTEKNKRDYRAACEVDDTGLAVPVAICAVCVDGRSDDEMVRYIDAKLGGLTLEQGGAE